MPTLEEIIAGAAVSDQVRKKGCENATKDILQGIDLIRKMSYETSLSPEKKAPYEVLTFGGDTARTDVEIPVSGDFIQVEVSTTGGAFYAAKSVFELRLNEKTNPLLDLSQIRSIEASFYRLFLTNTWGKGSLTLRIAEGARIHAVEEVQIADKIHIGCPALSAGETEACTYTPEAGEIWELTEIQERLTVGATDSYIQAWVKIYTETPYQYLIDLAGSAVVAGGRFGGKLYLDKNCSIVIKAHNAHTDYATWYFYISMVKVA